MKLSKRDCENLLDALAEYDDQICPKELADDEVGLNAERLDNLTKRLTKQVDPEVQYSSLLTSIHDLEVIELLGTASIITKTLCCDLTSDRCLSEGAR